MVQITDADILALLNGQPVAKDATVSDVHVASADDDDKAKAAVEGGAKAPVEEKPTSQAEVEKALTIAIAKADVVFFKGEADLYVSRPLPKGSAERLHAWAVAQGLPNVVPPDLMHVTVAHSKAEVDTAKVTPESTLMDIPTDSRWIGRLGKDGAAVVMQFYSKDLQDRFRQFIGAGASWDFPSYMPHITLSYDAPPPAPAKDNEVPSSLDVWSMLDAPRDPLQLGPEVWAKSNDNWTKDNNLAKEYAVKVAKKDAARQIIGGWASVSTIGGKIVVDKQDDMIEPDELEKGFHEFVKSSRKHGEMHEFVGTGDLIACLTFTKAKEAFGIFAKDLETGQPMEATWVEFKVEDPGTWSRIESGALREFSIGGRATPVPV